MRALLTARGRDDRSESSQWRLYIYKYSFTFLSFEWNVQRPREFIIAQEWRRGWAVIGKLHAVLIRG